MNGHFVVVCSSCDKIVDECMCDPSQWCRQIKQCTCGGCTATNESLVTTGEAQILALQNKIDAIKNDIRASILLPLMPLNILNILNQALKK